MALQIERHDSGGQPRLVLSGGLDAASASSLLRAVKRAAQGHQELTLDLAQVGRADSVGVATLAESMVLSRRAGCTLRARGATQQLRQALDRVRAPAEESPLDRPPWLERIGGSVVSLWQGGFSFLQLLADTVYWSLIAPLRRRLPPPGATSDQAVRIGVDALPIVCLISFLIGLVIAFQAAYLMRQFGIGANIVVANLVGIVMVRELGPLMTAIVVAGRSGSAIAAELGTMTVGEEIDALRTLGIEPVRFLIVPRVYAISITQPALTLFAMACGIFGGYLIAAFYLDITATAYFRQTVRALDLGDLFQGLSKSLLFSWVIALTGCHYGLRITGGAVGVGRATTVAVVVSILAIIIVDSIFTTLATVF